jgi:hypothetical protein
MGAAFGFSANRVRAPKWCFYPPGVCRLPAGSLFEKRVSYAPTPGIVPHRGK